MEERNDIREISEDIRKYILSVVNEALKRLGISEPVAETSVYEDRYERVLLYKFESAPIKQMPVMFKNLVVDGHMALQKVKDEEEAKKNDYIYVKLNYSYSHFGGGFNGCELGYMTFRIDKGASETLNIDYRVRKTRGLEI